MELKRFLEKMSSDTPTPGGGSASALAGALSASLVAMVAGLSSKKDTTKKKGMEGIRKKGLSIQKRLFQAIDEDSKCLYKGISSSNKLIKRTSPSGQGNSKGVSKSHPDTPTGVSTISSTLGIFQDSYFKGQPEYNQ
jgi:formiminotetrahydrofolate cyclodeaminase